VPAGGHVQTEGGFSCARTTEYDTCRITQDESAGVERCDANLLQEHRRGDRYDEGLHPCCSRRVFHFDDDGILVQEDVEEFVVEGPRFEVNPLV
jgi:hypothetical protein